MGDRVGRLDAGVPRHGHRHRQAHRPAERAEVPHHLLDLLSPWEDGTVAWFQHEAKAAIADIERPGPESSARRWHRRSTCKPSSTTSTSQASSPRCGPDPRVRRRHRGLARPARRARSARGHPHGAHQPAPHPPRPRGDDGERPPVLQLRPGPRRPPAQRVHHGGHQAGARRPPRPHRRPLRAADGGRLPRRGPPSARPPARRISRTARQALGYKELLEHLEGSLPLDEAVDLAIRRTGRFARRQVAWFRRDPRIHWLEAPHEGDGNLLVDAFGAAVGS